MKLSAWIINFELAKKYDTIPIITDGGRTIESVRLFSLDGMQKISSRYIYVGAEAGFFGVESSADGVVLAAGEDMIILREADVTEVLNDIIVIFDDYRRMEERLQEAELSENPFQNMLNVIHKYFQCPMLFGQKDLRIYAMTDWYPESEVYAGWDEMKEFRTLTLSVIAATKSPDMKRYPETIKTVAIPVSPEERKNFSYQIRSNVYCRGSVWGHLYIYYKNLAISPAITQMARYFADEYGALIDRMTAADNTARYKKYTFLIDILNGAKAEPEKVEALKWQMGWPDGQQLRLYILRFDAQDTWEVFFDFSYRSIESSAKSEMVFPYENDIILISPRNGSHCEEMFSFIRSTIPQSRYCCAASYPFCELTDITEAYFQANFLLEHPYIERDEKNPFLRYDDHAFPGLIKYVQSNVKYRLFIMPELLKLRELDRETGTEYYKTLFWYIINNGHAANTAKQLYIHRNTLKYRMDRIEQIMQVDLLDNEMVAYLRLCYSLLLNEDPSEAAALKTGETGNEKIADQTEAK